jgi:hypothetical protein
MGRWKSSGGRGRHETVHRDARQAVSWLDDRHEVKKIILGPFKPGGGRGGRQVGDLVFKNECQAGLRVHAVTGEGLLELILLVDGDRRRSLLSQIAARWPRSAPRVPAAA